MSFHTAPRCLPGQHTLPPQCRAAPGKPRCPPFPASTRSHRHGWADGHPGEGPGERCFTLAPSVRAITCGGRGWRGQQTCNRRGGQGRTPYPPSPSEAFRCVPRPESGACRRQGQGVEQSRRRGPAPLSYLPVSSLPALPSRVGSLAARTLTTLVQLPSPPLLHPQVVPLLPHTQQGWGLLSLGQGRPGLFPVSLLSGGWGHFSTPRAQPGECGAGPRFVWDLGGCGARGLSLRQGTHVPLLWSKYSSWVQL